jgi:hypothetical protein
MGKRVSTYVTRRDRIWFSSECSKCASGGYDLVEARPSFGEVTSVAEQKRNAKKANGLSADLATTYNEFKQFEGKKYTGMRVGRGHTWHYDPGTWTETKLTPDKWEISFAVHKRRSGKAPEGSGVPVGTEYHWYILAHQNVKKLDANTYTTAMTGVKYKLAHKRADKTDWSTTDRGQRRRLIQNLEEMITEHSSDVEPTPAEAVAEQKRPARAGRRASVPAVRAMRRPAKRLPVLTRNSAS